MKNQTSIKIPKKYQVAIDEIIKDADGDYWVYLNDGYKSSDTMTYTIHEYTQKDVLKALQTIIKVEEEV